MQDTGDAEHKDSVVEDHGSVRGMGIHEASECACRGVEGVQLGYGYSGRCQLRSAIRGIMWLVKPFPIIGLSAVYAPKP